VFDIEWWFGRCAQPIATPPLVTKTPAAPVTSEQLTNPRAWNPDIMYGTSEKEAQDLQSYYTQEGKAYVGVTPPPKPDVCQWYQKLENEKCQIGGAGFWAAAVAAGLVGVLVLTRR
jgi:hypothetical protein